MKIAMGIEYDGSRYHGWQRQDTCVSVQQKIEEALSFVANEPIAIHCAGRTDTGVHALGQVIHFESNAERSASAWVFGANSRLPHDISVQWVKNVPDDFHARYSALSRRYHYYILNESIRPAIYRHHMTWFYQHLDVARMQQAAEYLVGEHDFSSFRSLACQAKSPVRTVDFIRLERTNSLIHMDIQANAFLHHMVRNIVGVLLTIGVGARDPLWAKEVLEAKDRKVAAVKAPANGLYLVQVAYEPVFDIPIVYKNRLLWQQNS